MCEAHPPEEPEHDHRHGKCDPDDREEGPDGTAQNTAHDHFCGGAQPHAGQCVAVGGGDRRAHGLRRFEEKNPANGRKHAPAAAMKLADTAAAGSHTGRV